MKVAEIFSMRYPAEITYGVISSVAIDVVDLVTRRWSSADESIGYQMVDADGASFLRGIMKMDGCVGAVSRCLERAQNATSKAANPSAVADLVQAFIADDGSPLFKHGALYRKGA